MRILLLLLISLSAGAQTVPILGSPKGPPVRAAGGLEVDSLLVVPVADTAAVNRVMARSPTARKAGALAWQNGELYRFMSGWSKVGQGASIDTSSLSSRINQRVRYIDTGAMLAAYPRTATVNTALAGKAPVVHTHNVTNIIGLGDSLAAIRAQLQPVYREITSATTVTANDYIINATGGTYTVSFAAIAVGRMIYVANTGNGTLTLDPPGTISGAATVTINTGFTAQLVSTGGGNFILVNQ